MPIRSHRYRWLAAAAVLVLGAAACSDDDGSGLTDDDVQQLSAELENDANDVIATSLYDNPGSQEHYLAEAEADEPDLYAEITEDGDVTFDEFRTIEDVRDAVNAYGDDIATAFRERAVAAAED